MTTVDAPAMTLTSQTLQSIPTSHTTPTSSHQLRLRQACDSCTTAKVKCDKGHPACQRCLDSEEVCQYSPSRRHGKRARRSRAAIQQTTPSSLASDPEAILSQPQKAAAEHCTTQHPADVLAWDSLDTTSLPANMIPTFPSELELDISDLLLWSTFEKPAYMPQDDPSSIVTTHVSILDQIPTGGEDTIRAGMLGGNGAQQPRTEAEHALECEARALAILRSLQCSPALHTPEQKEGIAVSPSNHTMNSSFSVNSMDTLLATNKAALNELTQLLECRCAEVSHMALLHLTILSKIVFWYNVVVTTTYNSEKVDLKPMKIQFGVLDLDDDDYATLHRAVLGRELQKAGNAVRAFEVRFASPNVPVCDREPPWGRTIIRAIREDLERCVNEIERRQNKPF